jgi:spore coat polysaccharide biosynthesis protein SpsF
MGSTRLPGKVLRLLAGDPVLAHIIRRVQATNGIDRVIVATTNEAEDAPVVALARERGAEVTRGPTDDVLTRYAMAFRQYGGPDDIGVRVTADCPCLDPALLAAGLETFRTAEPRPDYLSNTLVRSFPRGYDFEIFRVQALLDAAAEAKDAYCREHVTPFLYRHPERFTVQEFRREDPEGRANWRLTLDTPEDWLVLEYVFSRLIPGNPLFGLGDVERLLTMEPQVLSWNQNVAQKEV